MEIATDVVELRNGRGSRLAARFDRPARGPLRTRAIVAHCYTCSKDYAVVRRISRALAEHGAGVLRFDFEGVGESEGHFSDTNFSTYLGDQAAAAAWLRAHHGGGPELLVGHSLGGVVGVAAVAAGLVPEARAMVTVGSPAGPADTVRTLARQVPDVRERPWTDVSIGGRTWRVTREMLADFERHDLLAALRSLSVPLLVLQAPDDSYLDPASGGRLFEAAAGPRAFVSLDGTDHLLGRPADSAWVGRLIVAWASRWVSLSAEETP